MNITLMRHPHTVFHDGGQVLRVEHDPDISPYGRRQLDNYLGSLPIGERRKFDHIFSSNLRRALHPAREIAEAMEVGHTSYPFLNELNWDESWQGADYYDIHQRIQRWQKADLFYDYLQGPGGNTESLEDHQQRVNEGWENFLDSLGCPDSFCGAGRYNNILVISHHLTISCIISQMVGGVGKSHPYELDFMSKVVFTRTTFGQWRAKI